MSGFLALESVYCQLRHYSNCWRSGQHSTQLFMENIVRAFLWSSRWKSGSYGRSFSFPCWPICALPFFFHSDKIRFTRCLIWAANHDRSREHCWMLSPLIISFLPFFVLKKLLIRSHESFIDPFQEKLIWHRLCEAVSLDSKSKQRLWWKNKTHFDTFEKRNTWICCNQEAFRQTLFVVGRLCSFFKPARPQDCNISVSMKSDRLKPVFLTWTWTYRLSSLKKGSSVGCRLL